MLGLGLDVYQQQTHTLLLGIMERKPITVMHMVQAADTTTSQYHILFKIDDSQK